MISHPRTGFLRRTFSSFQMVSADKSHDVAINFKNRRAEVKTQAGGIR